MNLITLEHSKRFPWKIKHNLHIVMCSKINVKTLRLDFETFLILRNKTNPFSCLVMFETLLSTSWVLSVLLACTTHSLVPLMVVQMVNMMISSRRPQNMHRIGVPHSSEVSGAPEEINLVYFQNEKKSRSLSLGSRHP